MSRNGPGKMDVRSAWDAWSSSGSSAAAEEFLARIGPWTDGTAAQLTRGAGRGGAVRVTRDEVADRLRHHLGVVAGGEPVTYVEALDRARQGVLDELRRNLTP